MVQYRTIPYNMVQYSTVRYSAGTVSYGTVPHCTMRYRTVAALYRTVLYCTMMYIRYHTVPYRIVVWYGPVPVYASYLYHIGLLLRIRLVSSHLGVPSTSLRLYDAFMMRHSCLTLFAGNTYASPLDIIPNIEWLTR